LRRFVEGGPRRFSQQVDTYYGVASFDGKFGLFDHEWYWDVNGLFGQNIARQRMLGNINSQKLGIALGPLATCNATPGCVPFNLFGGAGSITQAMMDYVTFIQNDESEQSIWDFSANVSGELFDLPGGALGLRWASNIASSADGSIRIPVGCRGPLARTFPGAAHPRAAMMSRRPMRD
jgi:iron complex outermembrane receptor protein